MNFKYVIILVFFTIIVSSVITYFVTRGTSYYDPLTNPDIQKSKKELELKDSLNNEIIDVLQKRIEDKQYIIDNILQKQLVESQNKVKYYSAKKDDELKYINSLDEMQLQKDINSKILKRRN